MSTVKMLALASFLGGCAASHDPSRVAEGPPTEAPAVDATPSPTPTPVGPLPGRPLGYGFAFPDKDGKGVHGFIKIAPGSPKLPITYWRAGDRSDKATIVLDRLGDCDSQPLRWLCNYHSTDDMMKITINYNVEFEAYLLQSLTWDGAPIKDQDIFVDNDALGGGGTTN